MVTRYDNRSPEQAGPEQAEPGYPARVARHYSPTQFQAYHSKVVWFFGCNVAVT